MTTLIDIPTAIGTALGVSAGTGGLILSFALIAMLALVLAAVKLDAMPSAFVLVAFTGMLTAFQWFPLGLFVLGIIVIVVFLLFGGSLGGKQ